jgi:structural maintenance of chromosome 2
LKTRATLKHLQEITGVLPVRAWEWTEGRKEVDKKQAEMDKKEKDMGKTKKERDRFVREQRKTRRTLRQSEIRI